MRFKTQQKHMIDFLFPIALFFVFAVSALAVILLATRIYRSTTENSALNYTARTSLSYISEKLHQNDADGSVTLGDFEGLDALILEQSYQGSLYRTYIYVYENELKELFIKDGASVNPGSGRTILSVDEFLMKKTDDNLFSFSCTDTKGEHASTVVSIRSRKS